MEKFLAFIENASLMCPIVLTGYIAYNSLFLDKLTIYYYISIGILFLLDGMFDNMYKRIKGEEKKKPLFAAILLTIDSLLVVILSVLEFIHLRYGWI